MTDPYEPFMHDIPKHLQEDAIRSMSEAVSGYGSPDNVEIIETEQIDAFNNRAHGIITIEGKEYTFEMEDGNRDGTQLLKWNQEIDFVKYPRTVWTLQPIASMIACAIEMKTGMTLIRSWDSAMEKSVVKQIIEGYAYDSFFAPCSESLQYWHRQARRNDLEIVSQETADMTRVSLIRNAC